MIETKDLILRCAVMDDWKAMYDNLWRHPESAKNMLWSVTESEEDAKARMARTIAFETDHPGCYLVIEKATNQAIGFAGLEPRGPGIYGETGIAIGPAFTGRGYGKQILSSLMDTAKYVYHAEKFEYCYRIGNIPSEKLMNSMGFTPTFQESCIDPRDSAPYILQHAEKKL